MDKNVVYEAYREILKAISGYDLEFFINSGDIVKVENGELCFYEDISYHGSPCYQKCRTVSLTEEEFIILGNLLEMRKDIQKINAEHEIKRLKSERDFIDSQIESIEKSGKLNNKK